MARAPGFGMARGPIVCEEERSIAPGYDAGGFLVPVEFDQVRDRMDVLQHVLQLCCIWSDYRWT
jgi:hypothetical protein